jgi:gluconate 5-dehydrogenase
MAMNEKSRGFFELNGKVAFLPGGYGDLGRAIARSLCEKGAKVVVAGRSLAKGQALAAEIRGEGATLRPSPRCPVAGDPQGR